MEDYQAKSTVAKATQWERSWCLYHSFRRKNGFLSIIWKSWTVLWSTPIPSKLKKIGRKKDTDNILNYIYSRSVKKSAINPFHPKLPTTWVTLPARSMLQFLGGDKKKLIELSLRNLDYYITQKRRVKPNVKQTKSCGKNSHHSEGWPPDEGFTHALGVLTTQHSGTNHWPGCVVFKKCQAN